MNLLNSLVNANKRYIVYSITLFLVLVSSISFFGVCGSFEIVRYTGESADGRQGLTYLHINDRSDTISINRFLEVKKALDDQYVHVDRLNDDRLQNEAITGMVSTLNDRYTRYIESGYEDQISRLDGTLVGIGISVVMGLDNETVITQVFPEGPADRAGLEKGDVIVYVDGIDVRKMALSDIAKLIRGVPQSKVTIDVNRPNLDAKFRYEIIRELVEMPSVYVEEPEPGIFLISIPRFTDRTYDELTDALEPIVNNHSVDYPKALILDLRNNSGGYVDTAIDVASAFIGPSVVFYQQDKTQNREPVTAEKDSIIPTGMNMVVLVNARTASAGEIVAGALQDTGRYPLIGLSTYGKGAITTLKPIASSSALFLTSALWYTPNLRSVEVTGLTPDIEIQQMLESDTVPVIPDIIKVAVEHLRKMG